FDAGNMRNQFGPTHWSKKTYGVVLHAITLQVGGNEFFISNAQVVTRRGGWIVSQEPRNTVVISLAVLPDHRFLKEIRRGEVIDSSRVSLYCVGKFLIEGRSSSVHFG